MDKMVLSKQFKFVMQGTIYFGTKDMWNQRYLGQFYVSGERSIDDLSVSFLRLTLVVVFLF